jgi:hypothetical protein
MLVVYRKYLFFLTITFRTWIINRIRKRSSTTRSNNTSSKKANARSRTRSSIRGISATFSRLNKNKYKRSILGSSSNSRSSIRSAHAVNNNAIRHGRSTNASRGTRKNMSSTGTRKKKTKSITGRLNNKKGGKNNNNNKRRRQLRPDQQSKKIVFFLK